MQESAPFLGSSQTAEGANSVVWKGRLQDPLIKGNPKYMYNQFSLDCVELGKLTPLMMMGNYIGDSFREQEKEHCRGVPCPNHEEERKDSLYWITVTSGRLWMRWDLPVCWQE